MRKRLVPATVVACSEIVVGIGRGLLAGAAVLAILIPTYNRSDQGLRSPAVMSVSVPAAGPNFADFGKETASADARHVADWVADSRDAGGLDFIIVDKIDAKVFVFDVHARLRGASPVLLGAARGDDSVLGIGVRPIADVRPEERTTPAGRFVAERGRNLLGEDVIWVDYDAAVSMHRVRTGNPKERRLERLATPTVEDNRITFGCINVPKVFYEGYIRPTVAIRQAVIYVLPEIKPVHQVFGSYDVAAAHSLVSD